MTRINYPSVSPYANTPQTSWYIGRYVDRPIPPDLSDIPLTLLPRYQYRPDTLAYDLYNNPSYWWVFMRRNLNAIRDPIWDMITGSDIWVPTVDRLKQLLGGS